jgi:hypothetical protein
MFNFVDSNTSFIMKKLSLVGLLVVIFSNILIAQVPQAINYQAVARDNAGLEIVNTNITVRFSIGGAGVSSGTFDYQETHITSTNDFGLFNVKMGQGTPTGPAVTAINWNTQRFLLVEVNFGSGFEQMGVAQPFVTVPYAILAQDVVNKELPNSANNNDILSWNGSAWVAAAPGSISETTTTLVNNGNGTFTYTNELGTAITFDANIDDADADASNEIQDLQLLGNILTITNNGSATPVDLSIYRELPATAVVGQVLTWNGTAWVAQNSGSGADNWGSQTVVTDGTTITGNGTAGNPLVGFNGQYSSLTGTPTIPTQTSQLTNNSGFITTEVDGSVTNELQTISLAGSNLTLSNGGGTVSINDADSSPTNEIQNITVSGNALNISGGGTGTTLSTNAPSTNQVLTWNGSAWIAQNAGSGADNWGSQTVVTDGTTITGNGTAGNPLVGFDGQYSSLTGTPTIPTQTSQLTNNSGFITTEVDGSVTNEIQNITVSGNALNISGGGTGTTLSTNAPSTNQVLTWNGTAWVAQNAGSGADNWGSQVAVTDGTTITGNGTAGNPLLVARPLPNTATTGQTITWNGTSWVASNVAVVPTYAAGTGVSITGTSPNFTINNTAPDQTVAISGTGATTVSGTYPNFSVASTDNQTLTKTGNALSISGGNSINISNTAPASNQVLTWNGANWIAATPATAPTYTAGTGININGSNVISNTSPDQTVVMNAGTGISITGTYPNFTVTNSSPNQVLTLTGVGGSTVSGTYPNLTISSTDAQTLTYASNSLSISGGNSVTIPALPAGTVNQTLRHDGTNWVADSYIYNNGSSVGIGTTAPSANLHVNQTINGAGAQQMISNSSNATNSSSALSFTNSVPAQGYMIGLDNTTGTFKISNSSANINANNRIQIDPSGNVGIGNFVGVNSRLDIQSPSFNLLRLTTTGANSNVNIDIHTTGLGSAQFSQNGGTGGYRFLTQGNGITSVLEIQDNGRVAVNSNSLALSALDVNGQITMRTGAVAGYVPVSNAAGTMTWTDPSTIVTSGPWTKTGVSIYPTVLTDNVGIGTNAPSTSLHIEGDESSTTTSAFSGAPKSSIRVHNTNLTNNNFSSFAFTTQLSNAANSEMSKIVGVNVNHTIGSQQGDLAFMTRNSSNLNEVMRITGTGFVGIGTNNPISKLDVVNAASARTVQSANSFASPTLEKFSFYGYTSGTGAANNYGAAFDAGGSTGTNYGVSGQALGSSGIKIGVHGAAVGTGTNWAGYFESGDVYIQNNLGIGTIVPGHKLHVDGNTLLDGVTQVGGTAALAAQFKVINAANFNLSMLVTGSTGNQFVIQNSTGNVTIGNTTAVTRLFVQDNNTSTTGTGNSYVSLQNLANTNSTSTGVRFRVGGTTGLNGDFHYKGAIFFSRTGVNGEGDMIFATNNTATSDNVTTTDAAMVIRSTGVVGIGTTIPNSTLHINRPTTSTDAAFRVQNAGTTNFMVANNGNIALSNNAAPAYKLQLNVDEAAKPTSNTWTVVSDKNLKKDIKPFTGGLADVLKINPVWFTYNGKAGMPNDTGVGVIAQEIQQIAPFMVNEWEYVPQDEKTGEIIGNPEKYLAVNNGAMTYMLINAIKEQQQMIEEMKIIIEQLQLQINELITDK